MRLRHDQGMDRVSVRIDLGSEDAQFCRCQRKVC